MLLTDTRGKKSITLTAVVAGLSILSLKFLVSGMTLWKLGVQPTIGAGEYGAAFLAILAVWAQREYVEKTKL